MPDPQRIRRELTELLSQPRFSSILHHKNEFRKPLSKPETPASIAERTAKYLHENNPLMNPIEVVELRGPLQLYRAHDGGAGLKTARTLGGSWMEKSVAKKIWEGTRTFSGDRKKRYMEFMRTANFVLPEWNGMLYLACMVIPNSVVVVRGRGSWKAMVTPPGGTRPGGAASIKTAHDVLREGMMPIPGEVQCVVPLYSDMWIQPVDPNSTTWPFIN
jgi:hypothetical protein